MTNSQSKIFETVAITCKDFHHPWSNSCIDAIGGCLVAATPYCLRAYTAVYALSLLLRGRKIKLDDVKRTFLSILQSTAFLVTNAYGFIMFNCLFRNLLGCYYHATVAFIPCIFASLMALSIERPARRPMLTLYVANVATETLWNMAEMRGLVGSMPHGQTVIFGVSISILLYLYRLGLHQTTCKDSIFNILKIFIGKTEEGPLEKPIMTTRTSRPPLNFTTISGLIQIYTRFLEVVKSKHATCKHKASCLNYALLGGLKPFLGGVAIQLVLKLVMNSKKLLSMKLDYWKTFSDKSLLNLGIFLGGFSFLYKSISCLLRRSFDYDDPKFALPAGLIASFTFLYYPKNTIALYVMWKMFHLVYNLGIKNGIVPHVPGFTSFLYAICTSILFHAAALEPKTIRPSYFKFLEEISGGRFSHLALEPFDVYGHQARQNAKEVIEKLNIKIKLPKYAYNTSI